MIINLRRIRKLWLIYIFLLFFAFFMFALSIFIYLQSLPIDDIKTRVTRIHKNVKQKRVKTVIGQYIGTGNVFGNISQDDINKNNFSPISSQGANGNPVIIPSYENLISKRLFQINHFNILASDRMPLNRTLKEYRKKECIVKTYPNTLPTTTVIIVFHNEAWSVLLRTIWSVINRTPKHLLKEIILVDDASERTFLKEPLDKYIIDLPIKTIILRSNERKGLVQARIVGAKAAKGDVLTFLDSHCECSNGWIEPLLLRIKEKRNTVVCPVIDIISDENFGYIKTYDFLLGTFNWHLHFRWSVMNKEQIEKRHLDVTSSFPIPAMAGGLFSIDREYFFEMGSYDDKLRIWGGENIEMSLRIWQCGGSVEISPCSHVGHLFRKTSPYTFPGGTNEVLTENLARVALVWMDEWADFFFMYNPINETFKTNLDVTERLNLRKQLKCKNFEWYLKNVWPNNFFPNYDQFFGKIIHLNEQTKIYKHYKKFLLQIPKMTLNLSWSIINKYLESNSVNLLTYFDVEKDLCLQNLNIKLDKKSSSHIGIGNCKADPKLQDMFVISSTGQIMTNEGICLDVNENIEKSNNLTILRFGNCIQDVRQVWSYNVEKQQIVHKNSEMCLDKDGQHSSEKAYYVQLMPCSNSLSQKWALIPLPWRI